MLDKQTNKIIDRGKRRFPEWRININIRSFILIMMGIIIGIVLNKLISIIGKPPGTTCRYDEKYTLNDDISVGEEVLIKQDLKVKKQMEPQPCSKVIVTLRLRNLKPTITVTLQTEKL